ncbi:MAG: hypothetical protein K2N78_02615 [Oscillospiraceae bacterium]|nr:hypothetical protein [Oscillospiraceae bacterium]
MNFFIKHLKVNRDGVWIMLIFQAALFFFGFLIVVCINAFVNEDRDYATFGSMMALIATVFGGLVRGNGGAYRYRTAISMGQTRLSYILADPVVTAMNCVIGVAFAWLLNKFELWIYTLLYPGWELDFDLHSLMEWWYYIIFIVGICVADFCFGALQLRFGAKGFAAIWFPLCFAPMIISKAVEAAKDGGSSLLALIGRGILFLAGLLSPAVWGVMAVVVLLALLALSVVCYRTAEVRILSSCTLSCWIWRWFTS